MTIAAATAPTTTPTHRNYEHWLAEVRARFEVEDEFKLADAIFPFATAYLNGMTPRAAYEAFDAWAAA